MILGIKEGLANATYRAQTDRISITELKTFDESPWKYQQQYKLGKKDTPNSAQSLGTICHDLFLEPGKTKYFPYTLEDGSLRSKAGKAELTRIEEHCREHGLTPVDTETLEKAKRCVEATEKKFKEEYGDLALKTEVSFFTEDRKARFDAYAVDGRVIVFDYKTTKILPTNEDWAHEILKWKYHWQAAWYSDIFTELTGLVPETFTWIVQQTDGPEVCKIYDCDELTLRIGRYEYEKALKLFKKYSAIDTYPVMMPQERKCGLPGYYVDRFLKTTKKM